MKILTFVLSLILIGCSVPAAGKSFDDCGNPDILVRIYKDAKMDPKLIDLLTDVRAFQVEAYVPDKNERICRIQAQYDGMALVWAVRQERDTEGEIFYTFAYSPDTVLVMYLIEKEAK